MLMRYKIDVYQSRPIERCIFNFVFAISVQRTKAGRRIKTHSQLRNFALKKELTAEMVSTFSTGDMIFKTVISLKGRQFFIDQGLNTSIKTKSSNSYSSS